MKKADGVFNEDGQVEVKAPTKMDFDEHEQASIMFRELSKQFRSMGYALAERKKKSPIRILEAFIFEPLEEVELMGKAEKELLDICNRLMQYKAKIYEYAIIKQEELMKEED